MSHYVADRDEFEALQSLTDAGDGAQEVLDKYLEGGEIAEADTYAEYLTAVNAFDTRGRRTADCAGCDETTTTTTSWSWIWGVLEAMGIGAAVAILALLLDELGLAEIPEALL